MKFDLVENYVSSISANRTPLGPNSPESGGELSSTVTHSFRGVSDGTNHYVEFNTRYIVRPVEKPTVAHEFSLELINTCVFQTAGQLTDELARDVDFVGKVLAVAGPLAQERAREVLLRMGLDAELPVHQVAKSVSTLPPSKGKVAKPPRTLVPKKNTIKP